MDKQTVKQKAYHELKEYLLISLYLWLVFGLFIVYKSVILAEEHINMAFQGFALINALALGKIMLIAQAFHMGKRFENAPLIYPTLLKSWRHIHAALEAGATRDEILMVIKMASLLSIHSCSLGAPVLLEEANAAGKSSAKKAASTPACDQLKAIGQWNDVWNPFFELDPLWTDQFMATGGSIYAGSTLSAKEVELLSIAFDVSYTHMYAPGTRRHIRNALKAGATVDEIMEVLKLCVVQGVQACILAVSLLAEELEACETRR